MIVSASYRTDIPAFYGDWFERRLDAGFCTVRSPYGGKPYRVGLDRESVDGFVFWTKNAEPFLPVLERLAGAGYPFVVHYTINAYPRVLEISVIDWARAAEQARRIAALFGRRVVVWRYDPVIVTSRTPMSSHLDRFTRIAEALDGASDEVVVSFAGLYRKTRRNLKAAAKTDGLSWSDPPAARKAELIMRLGEIARAHGLALNLCSQPSLAGDGAGEARCVDARRLGDVAGTPIAAKPKGNRAGCACHESRDIGAYDTCPHGCIYCYAVASPAAAKRRHAGHQADAEMLS